MKAITFERFGGPEVLELKDVSIPLPAPGQLRIEVHAVGTNPVDAYNRTDGSWAGWTLPACPGYEAAGVVDLVGEDVSGINAGDRVVGMTAFPRIAGAYAEHLILEAAEVAHLHANTSFTDAAATPLAAGTAAAVLERLSLAPADRLLVIGSSGGVGSFLVQLAAADGLSVVAVARQRHHERLTALGAEVCLDYSQVTHTDDAQNLVGAPVDAIADLYGEDSLSMWLPSLRDTGQIAAVATSKLDLEEVLDRNLTYHGILITNDGDRTRRLVDQLGEGILTASVAHVLPLSAAAEAHALLESGSAGGKVVLLTERGELDVTQSTDPSGSMPTA